MASRPTWAAEEIRIGALNPLTGAGSPHGPGMQKAIALAVEQINAAGGPLGRKIRLFTEDGETSPEAGVTLKDDDLVYRTQASSVEELTRVVYNPNQPSYRAKLQQALASKPEVMAYSRSRFPIRGDGSAWRRCWTGSPTCGASSAAGPGC
ncbi:MAG: ABC transporter substrate-binding protein [Armatimonadota bacterium]|nr:ABC transporter substrate-binding protein [Armatimonadota bacterium]MDR7553916.1 ABC transporter substrate-binding protein [Armatimonadota bacterium]MDR7574114.1 ABC transporter substrate-binding protein [Armatimonadota bacterium]